MKELAQWAGFRFYIDAGSALLFEKLKISAEMETEEAEDQGQKYVSTKSGKPVEVSLNVILNAKLGVDVRAACMEFLEAAKTGKSGAFYMAGKRLFPFSVMMTKASTEEIQIAPGGKWVAANVAVTFRQSKNGTILGGVTEKKQQNYTYTAPKQDTPLLAIGALSMTDEQRKAAGLKPLASDPVTGIAKDAKTVSSGVTQSPSDNHPTSSGKTVSVSSAIAGKITKKTNGLVPYNK